LIPEFITFKYWDFEVDPKCKVYPYVSNYLPTKFGEFWTSGMILIQISKFG
jgi:hypothetical protein